MAVNVLKAVGTTTEMGDQPQAGALFTLGNTATGKI